MRIAILSFKYPIYLSPTIKAMISYFAEKSISVDVFVDHKKNGFEVNNKNIILLVPKSLLIFVERLKSNIGKYKILGRSLESYISRLYLIIERNIVFYKIRRKFKNNKYAYIFSIEAHSLKILSQIKILLKSTIYVSLELAAIISEYDKHEISAALSKCKACLVQSEERGKDLLRYLETDLEIGYLPVSVRPRIPKKVIRDSKKTKLIYSGYFAEWACLKEFLEEYMKIGENDLLLRLQGHAEGTHTFLEELRLLSENRKDIEFDLKYYTDDHHYKMLCSNDVGLALYMKNEEDTNWKNIIYSSGKIATYLWAGLPVITNIDEKITRKPPFLFISNITAAKLKEVIIKYNINSEVYRKAALELANSHYNYDKYMNTLVEKLMLV